MAMKLRWWLIDYFCHVFNESPYVFGPTKFNEWMQVFWIMIRLSPWVHPLDFKVWNLGFTNRRPHKGTMGFGNREHFIYKWYWWVYNIGVQFQWLTTSSSKGEYLDLDLNANTKYCSLLLSDMDGLYRVTKKPCQYSKAIAPSRWMISSKISTICVICNKCKIHNYSHPSWHGRNCSSIWKGHWWTTNMNSSAPLKFKLANGECINCFITFPLLEVLWPHKSKHTIGGPTWAISWHVHKIYTCKMCCI